MARPRGTDSAKMIQVIVTQALRGDGTEKDPVRRVTQYWSLEGTLLAEHDTELLNTKIKYEVKQSMVEHKNIYRSEDGTEVELRIKAECSTEEEKRRALAFIAQSSHRFYLEAAKEMFFVVKTANYEPTKKWCEFEKFIEVFVKVATTYAEYVETCRRIGCKNG